MTIKAFCFNPFYENTYIVYEDSREAWIFDPGCSNQSEEEEIIIFIKEKNLIVKKVLLTHAHIDHILGLDFICRYFNLYPEMHELEKQVLDSAKQISLMYGISYTAPSNKVMYIVDNQALRLSNSNILSIWTPGHSPGSLCYYFEKSNFLIGGDVLFEGSIGRTDLPGGDYNTLIHTIKTRLYPLGNEVVVYPGHGGLTTIGQEKLTNPFLN